ncbi:MAG TPA: PHP domain-containing protein, partial [Bacteroidales bacterium]|nr:PHP domain-containing protein [Bacteroidales bacterium]
MSDFTHLHVHTQYSILDGAASIEKLIAKAKNSGMDALAITDHGNMYGVLKFFNEATSKGIKPIIGCEMYVAEESRMNKRGKQDRSGFHLILLAKNLEGYHNLSRLCSKGFLEG